jgi:predicted amidophosphoribosyltransferase
MTAQRQICQQCRSAIDPDAKTCPECGQRPYPTPWWTPALYIGGALLVLCLVFWFVSRV